MSVSVFCLSMLRQVWPDRVLDWLLEILCERHVLPALAVVLGVRWARQGIPATLALQSALWASRQAAVLTPRSVKMRNRQSERCAREGRTAHVVCDPDACFGQFDLTLFV